MPLGLGCLVALVELITFLGVVWKAKEKDKHKRSPSKPRLMKVGKGLSLETGAEKIALILLQFPWSWVDSFSDSGAVGPSLPLQRLPSACLDPMAQGPKWPDGSGSKVRVPLIGFPPLPLLPSFFETAPRFADPSGSVEPS